MSKFVALGQLYPPTVKLFHKDPYATRSEATVIGVKDDYVVLDQTIFYPESGGQDPDHGSISGRKIIDVQDQWGRPIRLVDKAVEVPGVQVDTIIVHKLETDRPLAVDQRVECEVDWVRRYKLMRNHSASHFVFHMVNDVFSRRVQERLFTKGCHISVTGVRFDFGADIPSEWLAEIEEGVNCLIAMGMDIVMEAEPESSEIFYWRYGDIVIPCGGTHVRSAKELGQVKLRRSKKGKGLTRIGFDGVAGEAS